MAVYAALLRAINVGGTGKLPMSELRALCEAAGFQDVATYIQSGNVVFRTRLGATKVKQTLERALADKLGKPTGVHVRTPDELAAILERNPFKHAAKNRVLVYFFDCAVPKKDVAAVEIPAREEVAALGRELYVHYPDGSGRSKLKLRFAASATARNLNTVAKLAELCGVAPTTLRTPAGG